MVKSFAKNPNLQGLSANHGGGKSLLAFIVNLALPHKFVTPYTKNFVPISITPLSLAVAKANKFFLAYLEYFSL